MNINKGKKENQVRAEVQIRSLHFWSYFAYALVESP